MKPHKYLHHSQLLALCYNLAWSEKATTPKTVIPELHVPIHTPPNSCSFWEMWVRNSSLRLQLAFFPFYLTQSSLKKIQGAPAQEGCARSYFHALWKQQSLSSLPWPCQHLPLWSYRHKDRWPTQTCLSVLPFKWLWHDQMAFCVCLV